MLLVAFEEFEMIYIFCYFFYFHYHCQLVKVQLQQKSGGGAAAPPRPPCYYINTYTYSAQWKGLHENSFSKTEL